MYEEKLLEEIKRFIDTHLQEEITLKKISDAICYSEEHTSRLFKKMTGMNLFDYIRQYRLSQAAGELLKNGGRILDVALSFGFKSHEGFSRAFSSHFGISPLKFRNNKPEITLFMSSNVRLILKDREKYLKEYLMEKLVIFTQVIERPKRKLILLRGKNAKNYWDYCEEVGCDVWGQLLEIKNPLNEPIGMWLPENLRREGTSVYAQGVEVPADYREAVPGNLEMIELPACKYMIFQSNPYEDDDELMAEVIGKVQEAIKSYDPKLYGFKWAESEGPRFQLIPLASRGYIEGLPVRQS